MKKIFLSYKQTGISKNELDNNLGFLRKSIDDLGYESLVYYFDENIDLEASLLDKKFLENIKNSDIFLSFINYKEKSEGQLMELGMAYSLGKKIILLVNKKVTKNHYLIYGTTDKIYYFDRLEELDFKKILG